MQLSVHKNIDFLNNLWRKLDYFAPESYASRMGGAFHLLSKKTTTDEVFGKFFNSAEGWYSKLAFETPAIKIKIVGKGFDDYFSEPVLLINGKLSRCALKQNISNCVEKGLNVNSGAAALQNTPIDYPPAQVYRTALSYTIIPKVTKRVVEYFLCRLRNLANSSNVALTGTVFAVTPFADIVHNCLD